MKKTDLQYTGSLNKNAGFDLAIPENFNGILIYFIHGYKGYKNWGAWDLISSYFYKLGYGFAKCNLTHNGTSLEYPNQFTDLESFGQNRYSFELFDINCFISEVEKQLKNKVIITKRVLIGHSRGGGNAILSIPYIKSIDVLITWAAISDIEKRFPQGKELEQWKNDNVFYVLNGRTKQKMPHYYSFYKDYINHKLKLNIKSIAQNITIPWAIIHGDNDQAVEFSEAENLHRYCKQSKLIKIEDTNHVFGAKEPYLETDLPEKTKTLLKKTIEFINYNR